MWNYIKENAFVIMMIVGVLQFVFTLVITIILQRNSKRLLRFEVLKSIDTQWQDLNKMIITNPQLQSWSRHESLSNAPPEKIQKLNIVYYTLNTFQQIIRARNNKLIDAQSADTMINGHLAFLKQFKEEISIILSYDNGLDSDAKNLLSKI